MQVEQAAKKANFKSLTQSITHTDSKGIVNTVDGKCIDFSTEIVSILGVSKPILEDVIFCHQACSVSDVECNY